MNETQEPTAPPGPGDEQQNPPGSGDPHPTPSFRTRVENLRRDTSREVVGGVAAGIGREFGIDPLLVRVLFVIAAFAAGAGLVLYVACWMFIPRDGSDTSGFSTEFKVENDGQVRIIGLAAGAALAVVTALGSGYGIFGLPWNRFPGPLVVLLLGAAVVGGILSNRGENSGTGAPSVTAPVTVPARTPNGSVTTSGGSNWVLFALTSSVVAIAMGGLSLFAQLNFPVSTVHYLAIALGIIAVGTLTGTKWGNAGSLIGVGTVLGMVLLVMQFVPTVSVGEIDLKPRSADEVSQVVQLGLGQIDVDLSDVATEDLTGQVLFIENGVGNIDVIVPKGLDVNVFAETRLGSVNVFGQKGARFLDVRGDDPGALRIQATVKIGEVKVVRR